MKSMLFIAGIILAGVFPQLLFAQHYAGSIAPFQILKEDDSYDLVLPLNDNANALQLSAAFSKSTQGYTPEGVEDVIIYLIRERAPNIANTITTGIDRDNFYVGSGNDEYRKIFLDAILPVLRNAALLRQAIVVAEQQADKQFGAEQND